MRDNVGMQEGTKAHSCAYEAALCAYLATERGRDTRPIIQARLAQLVLAPLALESATVDLVHDLRVRLELMDELRRQRTLRPGLVSVRHPLLVSGSCAPPAASAPR